VLYVHIRLQGASWAFLTELLVLCASVSCYASPHVSMVCVCWLRNDLDVIRQQHLFTTERVPDMKRRCLLKQSVLCFGTKGKHMVTGDLNTASGARLSQAAPCTACLGQGAPSTVRSAPVQPCAQHSPCAHL